VHLKFNSSEEEYLFPQ